MAKFSGMIGFVISRENSPGIWKEVKEERHYTGDFVKTSKRYETSSEVIDNVRFLDDISIVADPFAHENFASIKYVCFGGVKWKISSVDIQYPRLILSIGGLYNEVKT